MKTKILILLIMVSAFVLRAYHLGYVPFWEDELYSVYRSDRPFFESIAITAQLPIHPPFYYALLSLWVKLFGVSTLAVRFLNVIFSVLAVFFIYKLGRILYNERTGLCAAILLTFSPLEIYYAQEAKQYAMSWSLSILSFWLFYRLMKRPSKTHAATYILVSVVSWYTSYLGIIYSSIQLVCLFFFQRFRSIGRLLWIYFFLLVLYVPWLIVVLGQSESWSCLLWILPTDHYLSLMARHIDYAMHLYPLSKRILPVSMILCVTFIVFALIKLEKSKPWRIAADLKKEDVMVLVWFFFPFAAFWLIDMFWFRCFSVDRYVSFVHIPLLLLLSKGICKIKFRLRLPILFFVVWYFFAMTIYPYYLNGRKQYAQRWKEIFSAIKKKDGPTSRVIFNEFRSEALRYYSKRVGLDFEETCAVFPGEAGAACKSFFLIGRTFQPAPVTPVRYYRYRRWVSGNLYVIWFKLKK